MRHTLRTFISHEIPFLTKVYLSSHLSFESLNLKYCHNRLRMEGWAMVSFEVSNWISEFKFNEDYLSLINLNMAIIYCSQNIKCI